MFKSIKLYIGKEVRPRDLALNLSEFGYLPQEQALEEGDYSLRGEVMDIFAATFEYPLRISFNYEIIENISSIDTINSKPLWQHQFIIILPKQKSPRRRLNYINDESPINLFIELKKGDFVVHTRHGIGRLLEIKKIHLNNYTEDAFVIEYANREKLFIPYSQAHLIQKFIGINKHKPRLNRLGTKEWQALKNRAQKGIAAVAIGLLNSQAQRLSLRGFSFSNDTDWQKQVEDSFEYTQTPDQLKTIQEVKQDMQSPHPMDRLICGEVGYGKTEVALRAAFKAVNDGKQTAFLVPTTLLAEQHYQNFTQRMKDFPVNIEMLSRFKSRGQQKAIIKELKSGKIDIIIATHRLLSNDVEFADLGLLIIDEEQRFGVRAKEKIKSIKADVDILTLSATPIPRTLYMGLMGVKDISTINTPPADRNPVATYVVEYDEDIISQAIKKELSRDGQIFFVHNQIYDIKGIARLIKRLAPDKTEIAYAHGQMPEKELERIMIDFIKKKIDCLISTTIIESGIDIPTANTLIVNNSHEFGLSDLHQLRGRVGRFNRKAYAYFLIPGRETLNPAARRRLEAIKKFSELGAGFKIAMEDMQIRGIGNLLGFEQHGYIQAVGFDLYCRMLKETVDFVKKTHVSSMEDVCQS